MTLTKSKRLLVAMIVFVILLVVFIVGIFNGMEPMSLGGGLSTISTPFVAYIFGETIRPSITANPPNLKEP